MGYTSYANVLQDVYRNFKSNIYQKSLLRKNGKIKKFMKKFLNKLTENYCFGRLGETYNKKANPIMET
jgi:hypothetical protein